MMTNVIQIIMAVIGAVGFSLVFNIHGAKLLITAFGGALTWGSYLLAYSLTDEIFVSCLIATCATMIFAEVMARVAKTPVVILLVPMLIPMIPGGDLYRMMSNLVLGDSVLTRMYSQQLLMEVGGIAFGIILISTALQVGNRLFRHA